MKNYAAFILSVLTIPFSMGCTLIYDTTSKFPLQDGKRPAVMLFWESVHPLSFLVRAQPVSIPGGSPSPL